MASGSPCSFGDLYNALYTRLSADIQLGQYAPGGVKAEHPDQGMPGPFVRVWYVTAKDDPIQDGQMSRAQTIFSFIGCMLDTDQSPGTGPNFIDGSYSSVMGAGALDLGSKRIYALLHGVTFIVNGFQVLCRAEGPYQMIDDSDGKYDVMTGWRFCAWVM